MVNVIDDFLSLREFETLKGTILGDSFPLFFQDYITDNTEIQSIKNLSFTHSIYRENLSTSPFYDMINEILFSKLEMKSLIRSKVNCYPNYTIAMPNFSGFIQLWIVSLFS